MRVAIILAVVVFPLPASAQAGIIIVGGEPIPKLVGVTPAGRAGEHISIGGSNLGDATSVQWSVLRLTPIIRNSSWIEVIVPSGTGTVEVSVTTPYGTTETGSIGDRFTYEPRPEVTTLGRRIEEHLIPEGKTGNVIEIWGEWLENATAVYFGSAPASYNIRGSRLIEATVPPGSGTVDVSVATIYGDSELTSADKFTYTPPPPPPPYPWPEPAPIPASIEPVASPEPSEASAPPPVKKTGPSHSHMRHHKRHKRRHVVPRHHRRPTGKHHRRSVG